MSPAALEPYKCTRCGHEWYPRKFDSDGRPVPPVKCPNTDCATRYWNRPRMTKAARAELVAKRTRAYHRRKRAEASSTPGSKA